MPPHQLRNLVRPGTIATAVYLLALSGYALIEHQAILAMTPNQFADFLAGCFAPLAFLWLVLGFFQQGDELRNSVAALQLQGEELRHSVEQQRQLVEVTREQLGVDRASQSAAAAEAARRAAPIFHVSGGFNGWSSPVVSSRFLIRNVGAECWKLNFTDQLDKVMQFPLFKNEAFFEISYDLVNGQEVMPVDLRIECVNNLGQTLNFEVRLNPADGQYGPEYEVSAQDGLFSQFLGS